MKSLSTERGRDRVRIERSQWRFDKVIFKKRMNALIASACGGALGMVVAGLLVLIPSQYRTSRRNQVVQIGVFATVSAMTAYLLYGY